MPDNHNQSNNVSSYLMATSDLKECPFCAELIQKKAVFCKYCHTQISTEQQVAVSQIHQVDFSSRKSQKQKSNLLSNVLIWAAISIIVVSILWCMLNTGSDKADTTKTTIASSSSTNSQGTADTSGPIINHNPAQVGQLTYQIDNVVLATSINSANGSGTKAAPQDATYLLIYLTVRNDGKAEADIRSSDSFKLVASDGTEFTPDYKTSIDVISDDEFSLHLQPGIEQKSATVFILPVKQVSNDLILWAGTGQEASVLLDSITYLGKVGPLWIDQNDHKTDNQPQLASTTDQGTVNEPQADPQSQSTPDNSTATNPNGLIDQIIATANNINDSSFDQAISSLEALSKPSAGNAQEAERLNKIGLQGLKSKQYEVFGPASG